MSSSTARPSPPSHGPSSPQPRWRLALWIGGAALLGFLAGFLLQNGQVNRARQQVVATSAALQAARLEATLSAAVIEAQGGRFEVARQQASDFYTGLQRRLLPVIDAGSQAEVRTMLADRDSIITALARNDPASTGTLAGVLTRLRETVRRAALDSSKVPGTP